MLAPFFKDRFEGGKELAKRLIKYKGKKVIVLAIPRGGIETSFPICKSLKSKFDLIITRKLPIPWNPEAGFGSISMDGTVCLNPEIAPFLGLKEEEIKEIVDSVFKEVKRRNEVYRKGKPFPEVKGKIVILVDDGLATGYTMLAALRSVKKLKPKKLIVAVPVASKQAAEIVKKECDEFICLYESEEPIFAVGSYYKEFPQLSDREVLNYLKEIKKLQA